MSLSVNYASTVTAAEVITGNAPFAVAVKKTITHDQLNTAATLGAISTPPVSLIACFQQALVSGAHSIDLTNLDGTNGIAVDFTGLKVQVAKFRNPSTNANQITITTGGTAGYALFGTIVLKPGDEWTYKGKSTSPTVSGSFATFDLTGTGTQALDVLLIAG